MTRAVRATALTAADESPRTRLMCVERGMTLGLTHSVTDCGGAPCCTHAPRLPTRDSDAHVSLTDDHLLRIAAKAPVPDVLLDVRGDSAK